jgi:hypothetical protein
MSIRLKNSYSGPSSSFVLPFRFLRHFTEINDLELFEEHF